jgi:DNA-binding NtrC family response regulator
MAKTGRALVAVTDCENRDALVRSLAVCGLEPILSSTLDEVQATLASEAIDLFFCDPAFAEDSFDDLPRDMSSGELRPPVIVCARVYDAGVYLQVIYEGAFDYMIYPYGTDEVRWILDTAFRRFSQPAARPNVNSGRAIAA